MAGRSLVADVVFVDLAVAVVVFAVANFLRRLAAAGALFDCVQIRIGVDALVVVVIRIERIVQVDDAVGRRAGLADVADDLARRDFFAVRRGADARPELLQVAEEVVPTAAVHDGDLVARVGAVFDIAQRPGDGREDGGALVRPDVVAEVAAGHEVAVRVRVVAGPLGVIAGRLVVARVVFALHREDAQLRLAGGLLVNFIDLFDRWPRRPVLRSPRDASGLERDGDEKNQATKRAQHPPMLAARG
jgi:hypothetical protein